MSDTTEKTMDSALEEKPLVLPKQVRNLRIMDAKFSLSKKASTPMFSFEVELDDNPQEVINGQTVNVNGLKPRDMYLTITEKSLKYLGYIHKAGGLSTKGVTVASILAAPKPSIYIGVKFRAIVVSVETQKKNEATGEPVLHPDTKQPISRWSLEVMEVI